MNKIKNSMSPEKEDDISIQMFNVLVQKEIAVNASRDPNRSMRERNRRDAEAEKLAAQFERLAKIAEGETLTREKPKGEAYSLAEYYLQRYPEGSLKVSKEGVPSLMAFARTLVDLDENDLIVTNSGKLEVESVGNLSIAMALNGKAIKEYSLAQLNTGFKRAKADLKN